MKKVLLFKNLLRAKRLSVSLLVAEGKTLPISLNKQNIRLVPPKQVSSYEGGVVPFEHPLKQEAFRGSIRKLLDVFRA